MLRRVFVIGLLVFSHSLIAQVKESSLEEVKVTNDLLQRPKVRLSFKQGKDLIQQSQPEDLGDMLKSVPGVTLKNYGGLGGLKTISSRGINGTHTGIYLDGFQMYNTQSSLIDLSQVQTENVQEIAFSYGTDEIKLQQVSAYFSLSNVFINRFEQQFSEDTFQLRFSSKYGSFSLFDQYLSAKYNRKSYYLSVFGKYRTCKGDFPYTLQNGSQPINETRINGDLNERSSGISFGKQFKNKSSLKLFGNYYDTDRGVPGAVILYNPTSSQRLYVKNAQVNLDYKFVLKKTLGRFYSSQRFEELVYLDSGYLNAAGFLKSKYNNQLNHSGLILRNKIGSWNLVYGVEEQLSTLQSNQFSENVKRFHSREMLEIGRTLGLIDIELLAAYQHCASFFGTERKDYAAFNPSLTIKTNRKFPILGSAAFTVKRSMRIPNFNELYYNQIGNMDLKPERATIFLLTSQNNFNLHKNKIDFTYSLFNNYINDKIVAIPTKNLFVWSIQNVGKVMIYGIDLSVNHKREFSKDFRVETIGMYTFQRALDVTDSKNSTYRDQIAYIPTHTASCSFSLSYKMWGLYTGAFINGGSYALNQNIPSNWVKGFYTLDCSLWYILPLKANQLKFQFSVKNITNYQYQYVMNYVMPGRNVLITLNYAIH